MGKCRGIAPKLQRPWPKCGQDGEVALPWSPAFPPSLSAVKIPFQPGKKLAAITLEISLETRKHLASRSGNFGGDTMWLMCTFTCNYYRNESEMVSSYLTPMNLHARLGLAWWDPGFWL